MKMNIAVDYVNIIFIFILIERQVKGEREIAYEHVLICRNGKQIGIPYILIVVERR